MYRPSFSAMGHTSLFQDAALRRRGENYNILLYPKIRPLKSRQGDAILEKTERIEGDMKKGSRHFYRRLLLVYTAILVGVVVLLVLYFISELRQQARETNLEYMEMEGTEGREYILDSMEDAEHIHSSLYNSYDEFNDLYHYLSDEIDVYYEKVFKSTVLPSGGSHGWDHAGRLRQHNNPGG